MIDAAGTSFVEQGYEKTIAAIAGVATGTFYQYFENKDDMLRVIAQIKRDEIYESMPQKTAQDMSFQAVFERVFNVRKGNAPDDLDEAEQVLIDSEFYWISDEAYLSW